MLAELFMVSRMGRLHGLNGSAGSRNRRYVPEIDHLRAFAAIYILLFHGTQRFFAWSIGADAFDKAWWFQTKNPFWAFLYEGHTAVSLFIVLSGFVLTLGVVDTDLRNFSPAKYLLNRALRIYPLFLFVIALGLMVYPERWSLTALLLRLFAGGVAGAIDLKQFTGVTWSVVAEDHCYLIFPFILLVVSRKNVRASLYLVAAMIALRIYLNALLGPSFFINYGSVFGRIDQFTIGCIAARFFFSENKRSPVLFVTALCLVLTYTYAFHLISPFPKMGAWRAVTPTIEAAVWAFCIVTYVGIAKGMHPRTSATLARIGLISYSIYLTHIPLVHWLGSVGMRFSIIADPVANAFLNSLLILLPATLLVSAVTYYAIERPFLLMRKRYVRTGRGVSSVQPQTAPPIMGG